MKKNKNEADSIALGVELNLLSDSDGSYRANIYKKLDKIKKDTKAHIKEGVNPKKFAKFSKLLHAIPAAKEIMNLYKPINK